MNMKALSRKDANGAFSLRRIICLSLSAALISVGISAVVAPASNATGTAGYEARFVSIVDTDGSAAIDGVGITGTSVGSAYDTTWDPTWGAYFGAWSNLFVNYVTAGHTFTVKYKVIDSNNSGAAVAGQAVYLRVNHAGVGYSGNGGASLAEVTAIPGWGSNSGCAFAADCAIIKAVSNSQGFVTWTFTNTNTDAEAEVRPAALNGKTPGLNAPYGATSFTLMPSFIPTTSGNSDFTGTVALEGNPPANALDRLEVHVMQAPPGFQPASETLTATTGLLGTHNEPGEATAITVTNNYFKVGSTYKSAYAYQGAAFSLTYHVVDSATGTSAADGTPVTLTINRKYTSSNAKFSVPTGVVNSYGGDSYPNGVHGKTLSGTTDASGNVTFSLVNSDSYCDALPYPADVNGSAMNTGGPKTQIALQSGGDLTEVISFLEIHFVRNPANEIKCTFPAHKADLVVSQASISADGNEVTCTATPGTLPYEGERLFSEPGYPDGIYRSHSLPTQATYYLVYNGVPVWAKSTAATTDASSAYADYIQTKSATLTSATFSIPKTWNPSSVATVACRIKQSAAYGASGTSTSSAIILKASGKSKKVKSLAKTTNVSMRLVSGFLNKDKSGAPTDYVDFSSDPVKNGWAQYYGPNIGVFYKYIKAGSSTTMTWNVTDAVSGAPYALKTVYLIVNKNYGGVENATFVRPGGGRVNANPYNDALQETRIMGITDPAGNVTFTLKNTNSASEAEPAPEALNKIQPTSVTPLFSTITLTAGLPETQETKDIIWGHITK